MNTIKLTQFSHGAGCGCKLSPQALESILKTQLPAANNPEIFNNLLVGNRDKDDAAVFKINEDLAIISTTDFFMPIVDDPFDFGYIASVNAISDIYAMAGQPLMAIAILGWPIDKIPAEVASIVLEGAKAACLKSAIPLAGGHSIDAPEPIFGLAVTGSVHPQQVKMNKGAKAGDLLFLTKALGVGIITTAQKRNIAEPADLNNAIESMKQLNSFGQSLAQIQAVHALTDVTGFGLLGHLLEMMQASDTSAAIDFSHIPVIRNIESYLQQQCFPGGTKRNLQSYAHYFGDMTEMQQNILADPQTSGGLLISVDASFAEEMAELLQKNKLYSKPIGRVVSRAEIKNQKIIEII